MRWLLPLLLLSACTRALDTPVDQVSCELFTDQSSCVAAGCEVVSGCCPSYSSVFPGCVQRSGTAPCSAGCPEPTCEEVADPTACSNRPDCYALLTYDERCNGDGCESHFTTCMTGSPSCSDTTCPNAGGDELCDGDTTYAYAGGSCAIGCVIASKCPTD